MKRVTVYSAEDTEKQIREHEAQGLHVAAVHDDLRKLPDGTEVVIARHITFLPSSCFKEIPKPFYPEFGTDKKLET